MVETTGLSFVANFSFSKEYKEKDKMYGLCKDTVETLLEKFQPKKTKHKTEIRNKSPANNCMDIFRSLRDCRASAGIFGRERPPLPNFFTDVMAMKTRKSDEPNTVQGDEINIKAVQAIYTTANIGFVHLPKSGGTSVEKILKNFTRLSIISHCDRFVRSIKQIQTVSRDGSTIRYSFGSKRSYGIHNFNNARRHFLYFTWLRNPIEKFISAFYYIQKTKPYGHHLFKKYVKSANNLTDFLKSTTNVRIQTFNNHFTRLLLFDDYPDVEVGFEDCCGSAIEESKVPEITEKHYVAAKRNLGTKMAFVGLTEEFKTSQDMLCYMLGLPTRSSDVHVNANPHRVNITEWERQEIERRNIWDIKLYEHARQIFDKQKQIYLKL
ncbi:uncharacterized protein LOC144448195 [Glandiceps talaboti]